MNPFTLLFVMIGIMFLVAFVFGVLGIKGDDVYGFKITKEFEKEKVLLNKCITADFLDSPKCDKINGGIGDNESKKVPFP